MNGNRQVGRLIATVLGMIAIGFVAGYFARVPVERWLTGLKTAAAERARQRYLATSYVGKPAVDMQSVALDGRSFELREKKGKVVILFFWASWCPYSRNALPGIQEIQQRYADREDFEIIGLSLDNDRVALGDFLAAHGVHWANIYEDGKSWGSSFVKPYEVRAIPSRWIIAKDMTVAGAELSQAAAEDQLSMLLENRPRPAAAGKQSAIEELSGGACAAPAAP